MLEYVRPAPDEVLTDIWFNHPFTYDAVAEHIGEDTIARMATVSLALVRHQFDTGEMIGNLLYENGCSEAAQCLGRLMGGLHDFGKLTRRDILTRVSSDRKFGRFERCWVTGEHSAEGGRQLRRLAAGAVNDPAARGLRYSAFSADMHHRELLRPAEYAKLPDRQLVLAYGITDCIRALDPLQAMGFDGSRGYVEAREGRRLTADMVFGLVEQERGRSWDEPPIVEGVEIDLEGFVSRALGLEMAESSRR